MTRFLFVAAAPTLASLRTSLRDHRHRWTMTFMADGRDAAVALEQFDVDVVASDVHNGASAGVTVLDAARSARPDAVRVALSDRLGTAAALDRFSAAHHVFALPLDVARFAGAVDRSIELRDRLADPALRALIGGIGSLPSPTTTVIELRAAFESATSDAHQVAEIIASDPAASTKVLQVVNSAYFGLPRPLIDPTEAVAFLGARSVGEIVMGDELMRSFRGRSRLVDAEIDHLRSVSTERADVARTLARRAGHSASAAGDVWTGAFLADIGRLLVLIAPPEVRPAVDAAMGVGPSATGGPRITAATLGAFLISSWGLPHHLVECVALGEEASLTHGADAAAFTWLARQVLAGDGDDRWTEPDWRRDLAGLGLVPADLADLTRLVPA